uniref:L-carnitine dehydratase/bile acid-inducible protein F n=1 Tax=uncultured Thiotrichaceae bacterium TaxID=298394 RepID=A0A6S6UEN9_9GAMM|nr:MAG: L-carnitine dehydratase/bile acid-inducible protein F [uncultured Thiotrichaceae bacterium]
MQKAALSHIRVLDMSRILAGPWAGQLLADLGAEVIKIERPGRGDDTRAWGPPWVKDQDGQDTTESAYYTCANRGKQSVTIDITSPEGQELVRQLVAKCDVLLENYKVGGLAKYGLDYESLKAVNPKLVYCSITGFGQTGPYKHRAGYDFMIQAMGGLMSITGVPEDQPGAGPQKVGVALADVLTGLYASNACLAALAYRDQTGKGQFIDMSLLDVQVASLANQASNYLVSGASPVRMGNAHPNIVPYQSFQAADGYFILAVGNDNQFARLCGLLGHEEWLAEAAYRTNQQRVQKRAELVPLLEPLFREQTTAYWLSELENLSVPCGPINTFEQVFEDEQVLARGMKVEADHPLAGKMAMVNCPIKMSESPVVTDKAPPVLGEHTEQVLAELLELTDAQREKLRGLGVV